MADPLKHLVDASVSTRLDDCHACDWSPTRLPTWSRRRRHCVTNPARAALAQAHAYAARVKRLALSGCAFRGGDSGDHHRQCARPL